jgi:capsular exopolysaccharide synthesis family protein
LAANVANGLAQSYIEHTYFIRYKAAAGLSQFMEKQLEELKAKMERSSAALAQFERELNVINPEEKTNILSARLLQLNTEYTNSQADRVKKEATYISVKGGSLEAAEVSTQGEALKKLLETLNAAEHKLAETKTVYGANHPEYRTALASVVEARRQIDEATASIGKRVSIEYTDAVKREQMLQRAVAETKADFDRLNARSFDYQTLKREADSDKKLYEELVRKIKEATINASFQNSSIRIADPALPAFRPEFPNIPLNLVLAFALSSIVSIGAAIAIDTLDNTVRDPEQISRTLKVEVVGSLPIIRSWRRQSALIPPRAVARAESANDESSDRSLSNFDEAIRTVRNSILLTDFDRRLGSVLMTSAAPSEGKSTVAVHLAIAHADQGHKTLLIDADMRRPSVHKFFQMPNTQGLSGVLSGSQRWRDVLLQPREGVDLHVLPAGPTTRRGADLVGKHLPVLLDEASAEFDLIIVDAPPLLGFPEPLQLAAAVDGVVVVTRAGQTSWAAVASVVKTLNRLRARTLGVILNEVHRELSSTYYYYGYYYKYYGRHRDDA